MAILDDIFSKSLTPYVQGQSSAAGVLTSVNTFSILFRELQPLSKVIDDFGEHTSINMWMGDSGCINYKQSSISIINQVLTPDDLVEFSVENPSLGSGSTQQHLAKQIILNYHYNERLKRYFYVGVTNIAAINSMGVTEIIEKNSPYLHDGLGATAYVTDTLLRRHSVTRQYAKGILPFKFMNLEIYDALTIQHPCIVGSTDNFQITQLTWDLMGGKISFEAVTI